MTHEPVPGLIDLFSINTRSEVPIYKQIISQVKLLIAAGKLTREDELPSIRALSVPLGVNPMTISKAYGILETEGIAVRRPGRPLVIGDFGDQRLNLEKRDRLRESLIEAVDVARRLDFDADAAAKIFRELLERDPQGPRRGEGS